MKKINNFTEFRINEAEDSTPTSNAALINSFFEALQEACEAVDMNYSYSYFAKNHEKAIENPKNPDAAYKALQAALNKEGWTEKAINSLFVNLGDDIVAIYNDGIGPDDEYIKKYPNLSPDAQGGAAQDIFLYFQTKGEKPVVAGYEYKEAALTQSLSEYWIKFGYGYQKTSYGQFVIDTQFGSVDKWYSFGAEIFVNTLVDPDDIGAVEPLSSLNSEWTGDDIKESLKTGFKYDAESHVITLDLTDVLDKHIAEDDQEFINAVLGICSEIGFKSKTDKYFKVSGAMQELNGKVVKLTMGN